MAKYSQEFKLKVVEYYYSGHGDATGKLQHLRFCESESTFDYMISTRLYVEQHGKPLAFYSDKHSVFRVNQSSKKDTKITQFGRVLSTLNIDIIFANSPQAKGRVERANRTLQDRLIKEMRLEVSVRLQRQMHGCPTLLSNLIVNLPRWPLIPRIYTGLSLKQPRN